MRDFLSSAISWISASLSIASMPFSSLRATPFDLVSALFACLTLSSPILTASSTASKSDLAISFLANFLFLSKFFWLIFFTFLTAFSALVIALLSVEPNSPPDPNPAPLSMVGAPRVMKPPVIIEPCSRAALK